MSEPVGTMAEEAAKLLGAVEGWLHSARSEVPEPHPAAGLGAECRICPLCQLMHLVRGARPELMDHLTEAATQLMLAARAAIETSEHRWASRRTDATVEHIDIG